MLDPSCGYIGCRGVGVETGASQQTSTSRRSTMSTSHSTRQNHILAILPDGELDRSHAHPELVTLRLGAILYEPGGQLQHAYFPTTPIRSSWEEIPCLAPPSYRTGACVPTGPPSPDLRRACPQRRWQVASRRIAGYVPAFAFRPGAIGGT